MLYFLGQLNSFSLAEFGYPTTDSYSSFMANYMVRSLLSALGVGTFRAKRQERSRGNEGVDGSDDRVWFRFHSWS